MLTDLPPAAVAHQRAVAAGRRRSLVPVLLVALLAAGTAWLTRGSLIDDAHITLGYARNVALHGTWGLLSDVPSATATSPLWVLVLAALTWPAGDAVRALGMAHVGISVVLVLVLSALARRTGLPVWTGPAAVAALLVHPLLLSVTGMETGLLVLLLAALALAGVAGRPVLFGLLAGAAFLTRMDAAVAVAALTLLSPAVLRRVHLALPVALAVAASWMTWSWYELGTAIPDTFIIKTQQETFGRWSVADGWRWYHGLYGVDAVVAFAPMALAVVALVLLGALLRRRSRPGRPRTLPWFALTAAGLLHWGTLVVLGVPPYHWYYGPLVACGLLGAVAATAALTARRARLRLPVAALVVAQVAASVVVDLGRDLPWRVMPVQSNFATSQAYDAMGAGLRAALTGPGGVRRVTTFGEIGHLAYRCDCVVDGFADPARVGPGIRREIEEATPLGRRLLELNYRHRVLPPAPGATAAGDGPGPVAEVPVVGHLVIVPAREVPPGARHWPLDLLPGGGEVVLVLDRPA